MTDKMPDAAADGNPRPRHEWARTLTRAVECLVDRTRETTRLERGLLPRPLLMGDGGIEVETHYRPGRTHSLLGGDFYDIVQEPDGTVHAVIGDVAGHGPDAAAIGIALRLAWRTLILSGITGPQQVRMLERVLVAERVDHRTFATLTAVRASSRDRVTQVIRAGHPGMLLHSRTDTVWLEAAGGPALGVMPGRATWPVSELTVPEGAGLVLLTDGLYEGYTGNGRERLGEAGLLTLARTVTAVRPGGFIDELIRRVEALASTSGGLDDDIAVVYLRWA
ncbi:PP2C family protein-serine/threonine phosphatase [Nocardia sp. NPDC052001]|uniref:PP2C family protein-serine/threonine phosphatase n=1 Tax=Nocardia sp. NPDC052001 TaxID=3154853 RepID=UPI0034488798